MADLTLNITDEGGTEDSLESEPVLRSPYRALVEMFKNGQTIAPGDPVMLDARTAANAAAAGDIEPIGDPA